MVNKKNSLKKLSDLEKVKLINNSLVLEGLSLKELSKKLALPKKEVILFMESQGFSFDEKEGYFKKPSSSPSIHPYSPKHEVCSHKNLNHSQNETLSFKDLVDEKNNKDSNSTLGEECNKKLENIDSLLSSLSEKLNIDEKNPSTLLPEIKNNLDEENKFKEVHTEEAKHKDNSLKDTTLLPTIVLQSPKISRTERRKQNKKGFLSSIISIIINLFSSNPKDKDLKPTLNLNKDKEEPIKFKNTKEVSNEDLLKNNTLLKEKSKIKELTPKKAEIEESKITSDQNELYKVLKVKNNINNLPQKVQAKEDLNKLYEEGICKEAYQEVAAEIQLIENTKSEVKSEYTEKNLKEDIHSIEHDEKDVLDFFNVTTNTAGNEISLSKESLNKENLEGKENIYDDFSKEKALLLEDEIINFKIDSPFLNDLKSNQLEDKNIDSSDLEKRITLLEKKVTELENFFMEIFYGILIK